MLCWAKKTTIFGPKQPQKPFKTAKRWETIGAAHVWLDFLASKSPLVPLNSTICPRNAPRRPLGQNGLKMGSSHLFVHPRWLRSIFGKMRLFDPFLTHFCSQNGWLVFKAFWDFRRAKTGSKQAKTTCFSIPRGLGATLKTAKFLLLVWGCLKAKMHRFWAILDHFGGGGVLGHIVVSESTKGLLARGSQAGHRVHQLCSFVWLFGTGFRLLRAKNRCFCPKTAHIWEGTS